MRRVDAAARDDYAGMVNDGLLFEKPPSFAELVARCRTIQDRANNVGHPASL
jgi:hypothetical protein